MLQGTLVTTNAQTIQTSCFLTFFQKSSKKKKSSGFLFLMEETSCPVVDDWSVILRWGVASAFSEPQTSLPLLCLKPCALRFPEAVEVQSSALQNKEGDYRSRNLGLGDSLRIPLRSADLGILSTCHDSVVAVVAAHRGLGGDLPKEGCSLTPLGATGSSVSPPLPAR